VNNPTSAEGNLGYCLFYDEKNGFRSTGESFKISDGEEKEIAAKCRAYFRNVSSLSMGDFLNWRTGIQTFNILKRLQIYAIIIALVAVFIAYFQVTMIIK